MKRASENRCTAAIFAALLAMVLLTGCGGEKADNEDSKPANPTLLVSAARAEVHPMTSELRLLGKTVAMRHVIMRAPTAGRVMGMKLVSGDSVRKGQVVAHVINREIEAAEAGLAVARKIDPQDAPALSASVGRYNHSAGIPVVAPESGVVSAPPVSSGQMVADLDTIVDLIDPASLYIDTSVPVSQLSLIRPGMSATVTTPFRPGIQFPARIDAILPSFDAASASSSVRTDFIGSDRIAQANAPVEVRVETASVPDAIVVPAAALFQDQGVDQYHVFVIGSDGRAHKRDIKVGLRDKDLVQATDGIKVGDLVVTSGGYALSDGLGVRVAQGNQ
ncbi:MAG TPA: efflux RND transporter periplasmic adaptor subunit [Candidatus Binatus sp.]|uniref:efflux RND transporter periplasmic adaptor subunit n=1 Tax=Candidatus Binatus sp. TaxID=2811406 RepID=UPI002F42FD96